MPRCAPPKCYKNQDGTCSLPNPWNVFQKSGLGRGLQGLMKRRAYENFKQAYMAQVGNDEVAYYASLCLDRPLLPLKRYVARLRQGLEQNRVHYTRECNISADVVALFDNMFPTTIDSTTLTVCQNIGRALLNKCVSPDDAKFYTFENVLGKGLNGFVFQCVYKGERRAIKMVFIKDPGVGNTVPFSGLEYIERISEAALRKEYGIHRLAIERSAGSSVFRVLNVYGQLAVFRPPRLASRIGVYIMQTLPYRTLQNEMEGFETQPAILRKVMRIPRVIKALHNLGLAHGDLHPENIAFDPVDVNQPPYIFDFGRSIDLFSPSLTATDDNRFRRLDYVIPLYVLLRQSTALYNTFLQGLDLSTEYEVTNMRIRNSLEEIFSPIENPTFGEIKRREDLIDGLLHYPMFSQERTFFDMVS